MLLPNVSDGQFDLYLWSGTEWVFNATLSGGADHVFGGLGVDRFCIVGIETGAGLDPNSATAFVTGVTLVGTGQAVMHMIRTPNLRHVAGWVGTAGFYYTSQERIGFSLDNPMFIAGLCRNFWGSSRFCSYRRIINYCSKWGNVDFGFWSVLVRFLNQKRTSW